MRLVRSKWRGLFPAGRDGRYQQTDAERWCDRGKLKLSIYRCWAVRSGGSQSHAVYCRAQMQTLSKHLLKHSSSHLTVYSPDISLTPLIIHPSLTGTLKFRVWQFTMADSVVHSFGFLWGHFKSRLRQPAACLSSCQLVVVEPKVPLFGRSDCQLLRQPCVCVCISHFPFSGSDWSPVRTFFILKVTGVY